MIIILALNKIQILNENYFLNKFIKAKIQLIVFRKKCMNNLRFKNDIENVLIDIYIIENCL